MRHGRLSSFPPDFDLPSCTVSEGWHLWLAGNPAKGWPPLRFLTPSDFPSGSSSRKRLSDWKYLMTDLAASLEVPSLRPIELAEARQDALVTALQRAWPSLSRSNNTRPNDWTLLTAVKELRIASYGEDASAKEPRSKRVRRAAPKAAPAVQIGAGTEEVLAILPIPPEEDAMDLDA